MPVPSRIFPVFLILLLTVLFFYSCATVPEVPEPGAETESAISLDEDTYRGVSYYAATGDPTSAIEAFEQAKQKNPEDPNTRVLYSSLLLAVGQFDEAEAELEAVLKNDPENINALYNLSLVQGAQGELEHRESTLQEILRIDEGEPRANASLENSIWNERIIARQRMPFSGVSKVILITLSPGWGTGMLCGKQRNIQSRLNSLTRLQKSTRTTPLSMPTGPAVNCVSVIPRVRKRI